MIQISTKNKQQVVPNDVMLLLLLRTDQSRFEMDLALAISKHGTVCIDRNYIIGTLMIALYLLTAITSTIHLEYGLYKTI